MRKFIGLANLSLFLAFVAGGIYNRASADAVFNPRIGIPGAILSAGAPFAGYGFTWLQSDLMFKTSRLFNLGLSYEFYWRGEGTHNELDARENGPVDGWFRQHSVGPRAEMNIFSLNSGDIYLAVAWSMVLWKGDRVESFTSGGQSCQFVRSGTGKFESTKFMGGYAFENSPYTINLGAGALYKSKVHGSDYSSFKMCENGLRDDSFRDKNNSSISPYLEAFVGLSI